LYFLYRGFANRGYWRGLGERFGFLPHSFTQTGPGAIWLHSISVGEVLACVPFLSRLRAEFPSSRIFVSTGTLAGRATAEEKLRGLTDGVFFAPVDYVFAVRRVLRVLQPSVVAIAETEIWPNLFREAKRTGAGCVIVNGRVSDRALRRYTRLRWFFRAVLPAADLVLAQTDEMRARFIEIGAPPERAVTGGNFKHDFEARAAAPDSPVMAWIEAQRPAKIWIAASTMPPLAAGDVDEDDAVLAAFRQLRESHRDLRLMLAPRRPERFDAAARKMEAAGIGYARRSSLGGGTASGAPVHVLLLDSIGELSGLFAAADVVFMGGTLAGRGGHNILEPAFFGKPVIMGPHMENFAEIAAEFTAAEACVRIQAPAELSSAVARLLDDSQRARAMGARALACASRRHGATVKSIDALRTNYRVPCYRPALLWFAIGWVLARAWHWGGRIQQASDRARCRTLTARVISVGNLTMGGTGKTPCVLRLAQILKAAGHTPGILTRGHGRISPVGSLALAPGATVSALHSGDEPQIFLRSGVAPVGIGANRFRTGTMLREKFGVDVVLLDDGFQHRKLARDVDIVLIDALDPFGGGEVFPLGRLREPLDGLARADVIVITRSGLSDLAPAIERAVRYWNLRAPVFRATMQPTAWVAQRTGAESPASRPPFARAGGFCGLGNPAAFRRTLARMGVELVDWVEFADHHRYRPYQLRRLAYQFGALGATALVTTEKDAVNLCEGCDDLVSPLALFWLRAEIVIERESELMLEIERRLTATPPAEHSHRTLR